MTRIDLIFEGYFVHNDEKIPRKRGIYCIYKVEISGNEKDIELVYIGQAQRGEKGDLRTRIADHGRTDFKDVFHYRGTKRLPKIIYFYSYADLSSRSEHEIDVAEAALIFKLQPPKNDDFKEEYNKDDVKIFLSGKIRDMPSEPFELNQGTTYEEYFLDDFLESCGIWVEES